MAKQNRRPSAQAPQAAQDKPATLKDLLKPEVLESLKAQANSMKAEEERQRAEKREKEEKERKAEQKRLENDFAHLLENSSGDWRKFK